VNSLIIDEDGIYDPRLVRRFQNNVGMGDHAALSIL
jgi:hypothetical protein